jgi:polysaccharide pyruvyl transferase WcaK-like protein
MLDRTPLHGRAALPSAAAEPFARTEQASVKLVIFNVKYSPNLGDGVIAQCLEHELKQCIKGTHIVSLDLAGRTRWSAPRDARARLRRLALLQLMPAWMRDGAVGMVLVLYLYIALRPAWRSALAKADLAVFGGGQLIQDSNLNFPLKLAAAASECHRRGLPIAVFAVGAAPSRSSIGRRLLGRLLRSPKLFHVSARDASSATELKKMGCEGVKLCRDPGLLAACVWPAPGLAARPRPLVGLGITHPALLRHHADEHTIEQDDVLIDLYLSLVHRLVAAGYDVVCFSNGAAEDEAILAVMRGLFFTADPATHRVRVAPRCNGPRDLAMLIAGFDAVIAHRLHACILAYSYKIPHVGLMWDSKVPAFFAMVHRDRYVLPLNASTKAAIVPLLEQAVGEGIDDVVHARVLAEATHGIRQLTDGLARALQKRREPRVSTPLSSVARGASWK